MSNAARDEVPVEDHVQVLVRRDPGQQLLGERVSRSTVPVLRCDTRVASSWNET